jgi:protein ImuB
MVQACRGKQLVACCCPRAASRGVMPGMPLAEATSLLAGMATMEAPWEPRRDAAALAALASWSIRFSPLAAPDPPDGLLLDVTGCRRLYPDERRLLNRVGNSLEQLGIRSRLAVAGTIGAAWALARFGAQERSVIEAGGERSAIEPLPIEALRLDPATVEALREVNIDRVGQLLAIPRLELAARFDERLLQRLDQAIGDRPEVIDPVRPGEPIVAERAFDGAVADLEPLLVAARELVDAASAALERVESGATWLVFTMVRLDASPVHAALRLCRPSREARHLWSLLRPRLEQMNLGCGVERIELCVRAARRLAHRQIEHTLAAGRSDAVAADRASGELIDTLTHRLGPERALRIRVVESHRPERVTQCVPAMDAATAASGPAAIAADDRPSRLLARPEPVEVMAMTPEGPPISIRRGGARRDIIAAHGPQRVSGEWWNSGADQATRDYFKVQDSGGRWLWIFREPESRRWFVHGEWA